MVGATDMEEVTSGALSGSGRSDAAKVVHRYGGSDVRSAVRLTKKRRRQGGPQTWRK